MSANAPGAPAIDGDPSVAVDVLVVGAGPAALAIATALLERGVTVAALALGDPRDPWPNTYGIWGEEVDRLGLADLLGHRWSNTLSWFGETPAPMAATTACSTKTSSSATGWSGVKRRVCSGTGAGRWRFTTPAAIRWSPPQTALS